MSRGAFGLYRDDGEVWNDAIEALGAQVPAGGLDHPVLPRWGDRLESSTVGRRAGPSGLDLDKVDVVTAVGDEVDLSRFRPIAAFEDAVSSSLQEAFGTVLSGAA